MKYTLRKMASVLMTLIMLFSNLPLASFAETDTYTAGSLDDQGGNGEGSVDLSGESLIAFTLADEDISNGKIFVRFSDPNGQPVSTAPGLKDGESLYAVAKIRKNNTDYYCWKSFNTFGTTELSLSDFLNASNQKLNNLVSGDRIGINLCDLYNHGGVYSFSNAETHYKGSAVQPGGLLATFQVTGADSETRTVKIHRPAHTIDVEFYDYDGETDRKSVV